MVDVIDRINQGLEERNMTQSELAEKTGINKGAISAYVNGRYSPKQRNIYLLAKALDVSLQWMMGYDVPVGRFSESYNIERFLSDTSYEPSPHEQEILYKYRILDEYGKEAVQLILEHEYKRSSNK